MAIITLPTRAYYFADGGGILINSASNITIEGYMELKSNEARNSGGKTITHFA